MNEQMVTLVMTSHDAELRERFGRFRECAGLASARSISFEERVGLLERMGEWAEKVQERIALLNREGAFVERAAGSLMDLIEDKALRLRLSNGLFDRDEIVDLLQVHSQLLPEGLISVIRRQAEKLHAGEYILFWSIGELEAHDLLSD